MNAFFKEALVKDVIIVFIFIIISQSLNAIFFMFMNFFVIFEDFKDVILSIQKKNLETFESVVQEVDVILNFAHIKFKKFIKLL